MTPKSQEPPQPQLDEKVWNAWLAKGAAEEKVAARKYRVVGVLVAVVAVGIYFFTGAN